MTEHREQRGRWRIAHNHNQPRSTTIEKTDDREQADLREAVRRAYEVVRRVRALAAGSVVPAAELAEAERAYDEVARRYAAYRITEALGPDPETLGAEVFEAVLLSMARPDRFIPKGAAVRPACLSHTTTAAMLCPFPPLADILMAVRKSSAPRDAFDQHTPVRQLLRAWAERTRTDPFIDQCLRDAAGQHAAFTRAVADAASVLNGLRLKYELDSREPERLLVERGADGRIEIMAVNTWSVLAQAFPADADQVYANIATAELAAGRIDHAVDDINRELSRFFAELVPRCFALAEALPRARRRELTGGVRLTRSLARKLIEAAASTDFTADPGCVLGVHQEMLPRRLKVLASHPKYERVRNVVMGRKIQDASTVVLERPAPTPRPERGE